jgi:hypothetical protein
VEFVSIIDRVIPACLNQYQNNGPALRRVIPKGETMFDDTTKETPEMKMQLYHKYDYSLLSARDIISNMTPELQQGTFYLDSDGKMNRDYRMDWNTPWIFGMSSPERNCLLWHRVMYGIFGMLPIWCRLNCWKVVVRPRTLEELFLLKELQENLRVPCKLGVETRKSVFGNYGGYFYTNSFEEGCDRLDQVRKAVASFISPKTPVYLKLGCTEFEHSFGPTDQYKAITKEEHRNEDTIRACFSEISCHFTQPQHLRDHIGQKWIHFAWERGDPTVTKFNKGEPLFPRCITYERPKPEEKPKKAKKKAGRK